ncbi:MAG: ABC transporter ATP-binding protein, partial [Planctomycetaceae bacterium]|nr:ABC transporter ATP-binding protein [Planctomycetaceae bacterium]
KEYSKGMTRRIGLAQALINDPDLVLLDEPTSGLDPIGRKEMKDLIINLRDQGKTVVICSHLLPDVQDVCDRIAILYAGELKVLGKFEDLLKSQGQTQLITSQLSQEAIADVKAALAKHQAELITVDHPTASLEDLFLTTVRESQERPGHRVVPDEEMSVTGDGQSSAN